MTEYLLTGGMVVDPARGREQRADLLIRGPEIAAVGLDLRGDDAEVVDVRGMVVAPGLVDMHTHVREPGREDEETIATASAAAAAGGYTAICAMPNTDPVADTAAVVEKVWALGRESDLVDVVPAGALSRGQTGDKMADLGEMARSVARVRLFTDDGKGVQSALFARRAMEYLVTFDGVFAEHCEDATLAAGGQMHEGECSAELGLRGIPSAAEELMAVRDIALAKLTGCRLHLLHVSTAGTIEAVRRAKADGVAITSEATPHHFTLTDSALRSYDPNAKVHPPLRAELDRRAVIEGLSDGTIDAIATDHAPHADHEKDQELSFAPPGMIGLETALSLGLAAVEAGMLPLPVLLAALSVRPASIVGEPRGLAIGSGADLVAFDPDARWRVARGDLVSRSSNTPLLGMELPGVVRLTVADGRVTYDSAGLDA